MSKIVKKQTFKIQHLWIIIDKNKEKKIVVSMKNFLGLSSSSAFSAWFTQYQPALCIVGSV